MLVQVVGAATQPAAQLHDILRASSKHCGRRKLFLDGASSICSRLVRCDGAVDGFSPFSVSSSASSRESVNRDEDFKESARYNLSSPTRRTLFASLAVCASLQLRPSSLSLGDPSVTIEDVSPIVYPSEPLFPSEERIAKLFEANTYSVVNIFDVTLRPQINATGLVEVPEGNGSGIVWDEEGHVVTNYHVVGNALSRNPDPNQVVARVNILTTEGVQKDFEGKLVGADRAKDLAVLKVEAPREILRPITLGERPDLKVGQQCLAIGNPFGFDHTLTVGVISGLNREIFSQTGVTIGGGIQTDAAINPGNSGGPLLDSKGRMIGINTAIFTQTGTSAGVGFAIPSSTVLRLVPQLISFGKVVRAGLNVDIAPDLVANQLNVRNGALVLRVQGTSLAGKAGLLPTTRGFAGKIILGDIIVAVDGKPVRSKAGLSKVLEDYNVGDKILARIRRGTETLDLSLTLEEASS